MKDSIHPKYRFVVFRDVSVNFQFLGRSCAEARETVVYEGTEYPCINLDISSMSHPFYTGTQKLLDTEGRVDRFKRKYGFGAAPAAAPAAAETSAAESKAE
jgi:large subunit ribosomal protein L31